MLKVNIRLNPRSQLTTIRNIRRVRYAILKKKSQTPWNAGQHLYSRTRAVVPYKEGDLYESAFLRKEIDTDEKTIWTVGYDLAKAPHGWMVHEIPGRMHPTRGPSSEPKQDHFLSEPADAMRKPYARTVRDDVNAAIASVRIERMRTRR